MPFLRPWRLLSPWWWMRRIAFLVVAAYLLVTGVQVWWASAHDASRPSGAIVVLGAAQYDGRASPVLAARLDHALELYREDVAPLVVVTGGGQEGDRTTQAAVGAAYLRRRGVPDRRIRLEVDGTNTYEELSAVRRFLRREGVDRIVIVTDGYHAARATATANEVGFDAVASPVPGTATWGRLVPEVGGVALGRIITFRRLSSVL